MASLEPHPFIEFDLGRAQALVTHLLGIFEMQPDNAALGSTGEKGLHRGSLTGVGLTALMTRWVLDNPRKEGA